MRLMDDELAALKAPHLPVGDLRGREGRERSLDECEATSPARRSTAVLALGV
jgi:hypothetical protein